MTALQKFKVTPDYTLTPYYAIICLPRNWVENVFLKSPEGTWEKQLICIASKAGRDIAREWLKRMRKIRSENDCLAKV